MNLSAALGFLLAVTPLALTPGVSFTLATQRAVAGERRAGLAVAAGTGTGIYVHSLLAGSALPPSSRGWRTGSPSSGSPAGST